MKTVELFSGTKSFSNVMEKQNYSTFTVDASYEYKPDLCIDIRKIYGGIFPVRPDILWASPPCTGFSIAARGKNWTRDIPTRPKSESAVLAIELALKTIDLIKEIDPKWWFIENPVGVLRKMPFMENVGIRHTIWYCRYGDTRAKPTDIWTNAYWWKPRPKCHNGNPDHESAPRGSKTGTQGLAGAMERGVVPPALFEEILEQMPV